MAKSQCETCGHWFEDSELDEHLSKHLDEPAPPTPEPKKLKCPDCNLPMNSFYGVPFKVGQSDPAGQLLLGWWSEGLDQPILIDLHICPQCGRMEQFANKKTLERLNRRPRPEPD